MHTGETFIIFSLTELDQEANAITAKNMAESVYFLCYQNMIPGGVFFLSSQEVYLAVISKIQPMRAN